MTRSAPRSPARLPRSARRCAGLSLAEMLISLAITAALLTAVTMSLNASFTAYASAAQSTSAQSNTRLVVHRVSKLIRNGIAQGPLSVPEANEWAASTTLVPPQAEDDAIVIGVQPPELVGFRQDPNDENLFYSQWMLLDDNAGALVMLVYDEPTQTLFYARPRGADYEYRPLLRGVTECTFTLSRRRARQIEQATIEVLDRGGIDLTVVPGADSSLGTEAGNAPPIRLVASTSPRRLR